MQDIGLPSKSFLSSHATSLLFDSERTVFESMWHRKSSGEGDGIQTSSAEVQVVGEAKENIANVMFCDIRGKFQAHAKLL